MSDGKTMGLRKNARQKAKEKKDGQKCFIFHITILSKNDNANKSKKRKATLPG
jgi:hypothetical protein